MSFCSFLAAESDFFKKNFNLGKPAYEAIKYIRSYYENDMLMKK